MQFGIVGAGLIGTKRARALPSGSVRVIYDRDASRAAALAKEVGARAVDSVEALVAVPEVDIVGISTFNYAIPAIAETVLRAGKHVLAEKPAGRKATELEICRRIADENNLRFFVGFNHRFHPAILEAKRLSSTGELGKVLYVRARYGHGGRRGYEKEWRADPSLSGGGELLDQGVHLIDLTRFFLGEMQLDWGRAEGFHWNMPVEDNGFLYLKNREGHAAWLHASCTEWKNTFEFEIFFDEGKIQICGFGGSYGEETLRVFRRAAQQGPPELIERAFPGADLSWQREHEEIEKALRGNASEAADVLDAEAALRIVEQVYASSPMYLR